MQPWESPHSLADGILDDETYDWISIGRAIERSSGRSVVAVESEIVHARAGQHIRTSDFGDGNRRCSWRLARAPPARLMIGQLLYCFPELHAEPERKSG